MFKLITRGLLLAGLVLVAVAGCSNNSVGSGDSFSSPSRIEDYFPMSQGYSTQYDVSYPNGTTEIVTFEVGPPALVQGGTANKWFVYDQNGNRSTSYLAETGSDLFFYETQNSSPERILSLPLKRGATWNRFDTNNDQITTGQGDITISTGLKGQLNGGGQGQGQTNGNGGPIAGKNFPTSGSNEVYVDGFETVMLSNGGVYSGALKLRNGGNGGYNFYWFAPGVGLVKYVIGAPSPESTDGAVVGELRAFGSK